MRKGHIKLVSSPGLYKKVCWESSGKQASKQHCFVISTSVPAFNIFPWVLSQISLGNGQQPLNKINPFFPKLLSYLGVYFSNRKLNWNKNWIKIYVKLCDLTLPPNTHLNSHSLLNCVWFNILQKVLVNYQMKSFGM